MFFQLMNQQCHNKDDILCSRLSILFTLKENKRIAIRFDKLDSTFLVFIALAFLLAFKRLS